MHVAFVSLCLNHNMQALEACRELLAGSVDFLDRRQHLVHLYAAEALCRLSRPAAAAALLSPSLLKDRRESPTQLDRAALYINLANVHALNGELSRAEKCANQALTAKQHLPEAVRLLVYINLRRGKMSDAFHILTHKQAPFVKRGGLKD